MALTDAQFALLQKSIDAIMERIASLHLSLAVDTDFRGLAEFLRERDAFVYPSFDPARSTLRGDCFWFRLTDSHGRTVASHADRIFTTDDFCELIETGELWFAEPAAMLNGHAVEVIRPPVKIAGTVGHSGSMWIDKPYRGKGISMFLPYLSRSLCLRNFDTDFHTGLVFKNLAESKVPRVYYGYPHVELCIDGYFPPTGKPEQLYLCWISQAEAIERVHALPQHDEFPVALESGLSVVDGASAPRPRHPAPTGPHVAAK
jgi:GNAT superfamily N-acetyltransferase